MCTVSVVPVNDGFRMVCNRDERRTRPAAEHPALQRIPNGTAVWPVDPLSGGTWIGVNDAGIAMALLNRSLTRAHETPRNTVSRGTIVPRFLRYRHVDDVVDAASALPLARYEPFTLVVLHSRTAVSITHAGRCVVLESSALARPLLFTSSSLGDELVAPPRRALFTRLVEHSASPLRGQRAFHRHAWRSRPEVSVRMQRGDAATVSRTVVDVTRHAARIRYTPLSNGRQ